MAAEAFGKIDGERAAGLVNALLSWYDKNKRDLPWRESADPYHVWVSEIMAQQTRIAALLPYYERFMALFPTVRTLARAETSDVLKAWEGLGYYARAHNLHDAAKIVVNEYGGEMPRTERGLLSLPGVGDYTAGAILSIAFGQAAPALDGNALRVLARLANCDADITRASTKAAAKAALESMMPAGRTGAFTQSLMEVGALVCVPKTPACEVCPLTAFCLGLAVGRQRMLPVRPPSRKQKRLDKTVLLIVDREGRALMRRRTEKLLRGLWAFYMADGRLDEEQAAAHVMELGFRCGKPRAVGGVCFAFTHLVWDMEGFAFLAENNAPPEGYAFVDAGGPEGVAVPAAHRFFLEQMELLKIH